MVGFTGLFFATVAILLYALRTLTKKTTKGIPGPVGLPILGHTLSVGDKPQNIFRKWALQYGEVFQVQIGWYPWVFVNSPAAVKEIFDKQSAVTSGRPRSPFLFDLMSGGMRILFMDYTPEWRKLRAVIHQLLTPKMSDTFQPSQEFEAKQLLHDLLTDNDDERSFYNHVRRYTTSVVMTSTYGRRIPHWVCFYIVMRRTKADML